MDFTVKQIADLIGGIVEGDDRTIINTLSKIEEAENGSLTFLSNLKYAHFLKDTKASAVIVYNDFDIERPEKTVFIKVKDPRAAIAQLLEFYNKITKPSSGISSNSSISKTAKIGSSVYIAEYVVIGDNVEIGNNVEIHPFVNIESGAKIGDGTIIYSFASIYYNVIVGNNCILHSGCVIGADGFGFIPKEDGTYDKIPQTGNVIIEDNVEIGANSCVDRATMGSTFIKKGVKLDNLVQIAHNTEIGENTVCAAQTGIAGSTKIGKNCLMGGQTGIVDNIKIADNTKFSANTCLFGNVKEPNTIIKGSPGFEMIKFNKAYIHFKNLDKMVKRLDELENQIRELKSAIQIANKE